MMSVIKDYVKYARCVNTEENDYFESFCKQEGMDIQFKYTMPCTPQQNGQVERIFSAPFNGVDDMLNSGKFLIS